MLDDLRNSANQSFQEEEQTPIEPSEMDARPRDSAPFLGMTASQRFVVALLLFLMTCVFGTFCLLVTQKVVLPFF